MSSPLGQLAFLVVDDNPNMVQIVRTVLKSFGIVHIYEAASVPEALTVVRQFSVDIVVLDYNLGPADGIEFIRHIRAAIGDDAEPCLPIIMLTAYTELHRVRAARDAGVTEFCCKPVTASELYRKIIEVIERPRDFVRSSNYFGPDRRRRSLAAYQGPERRRSARFSNAHALDDAPETGPYIAKAG